MENLSKILNYDESIEEKEISSIRTTETHRVLRIKSGSKWKKQIFDYVISHTLIKEKNSIEDEFITPSVNQKIAILVSSSINN